MANIFSGGNICTTALAAADAGKQDWESDESIWDLFLTDTELLLPDIFTDSLVLSWHVQRHWKGFWHWSLLSSWPRVCRVKISLAVVIIGPIIFPSNSSQVCCRVFQIYLPILLSKSNFDSVSCEVKSNSWLQEVNIKVRSSQMRSEWNIKLKSHLQAHMEGQSYVEIKLRRNCKCKFKCRFTIYSKSGR